MNSWVLALAALTVAPESGENSMLLPDRSTACFVSLSFVKSIVKAQGRKIIFTSWEGESSALASDPPKYNWGITTFGSRLKAQEPSADLAKRFHNQRGLSAVEECPIVKSYLRRKKIEFGSDAIIRAKKNPRKSDFLILSVTLAAVSDDGTIAILSNGQTGVHGGGGGWITAMSLDEKGNWDRSFTAPTWII
jgi:hypothetical protein